MVESPIGNTGVTVNAISLVASEDSTISNVSLYSGRAEITRNFKIGVKRGHNKVTIAGLPHVLQHNSVRVEGRGNASIHDVIVSKTPRNFSNEPTAPSTQPQVPSPLKRKRDEVQQDIATAQEVRNVLNNYLSSINASDFDKTRLAETLKTYLSLARTSDRELLDLGGQLAQLNEQIEQDQKKKKAPNASQVHIEVPSWQVSINIHGHLDEELQIVLKYAVYSADWSARYELRVDTKTTTGKSVKVFYKATVTQNTGESWDNIPLTLETSTPSFGIEIPTLSSWRVKTIQPRVEHHRRRSRSPRHASSRNRALSRSNSRERGPRNGDRRRSRRPRDSLSRSPRRRHHSQTPRSRSQSPVLVHHRAEVLHKSDIVATFRVPGLVSVASGGASHNFTVAELSLEAELFWYGVPSVDTRAHIKGKIKNDSEYSFIPGPANIYMDGSFVATTNLLAVSPQETFECPLGFDPSIRFTYHPRERKSAQSGFYNKTSTQTFTQRITITITKSSNLSYLKVVDRVPISEDERIEVKVLSPNLPVPTINSSSSSSSSTITTTTTTAPLPTSGGNSTGMMLTESRQALAQILKLPIRVSSCLAVQWEGADEPGVDQSSAGKNGKFYWMVAVPPQGTISLVLQFEVNYPEGLNIEGLCYD